MKKSLVLKNGILLLKRYRVFIGLAIINTTLLIIFPDFGKKSLSITWNNTFEMLSVIPPAFGLPRTS